MTKPDYKNDKKLHTNNIFSIKPERSCLTMVQKTEQNRLLKAMFDQFNAGEISERFQPSENNSVKLENGNDKITVGRVQKKKLLITMSEQFNKDEIKDECKSVENTWEHKRVYVKGGKIEKNKLMQKVSKHLKSNKVTVDKDLRKSSEYTLKRSLRLKN